MASISERLNRALRYGYQEYFGESELIRFQRLTPVGGAKSDLIQIASHLLSFVSLPEAEGAGIAIGRFAFPRIRTEFNDMLHFSEARFRILTPAERVRSGISRLIDDVFCPGGFPVLRAETAEAFEFEPQVNSTDPSDHVAAALLCGVLLESCAELTGGKMVRCEWIERNGFRLFFDPLNH